MSASKYLSYYVYAYLRKDGSPYYIGKGTGQRAWSGKHSRNGKSIIPRDRSRIVICEKNLTNIGAMALERQLIRWYGKLIDNTGVLINILDGGDTSRSNYKLSKTTRKKISQKLKGKKSPLKGRTYEEIYGKEAAEKLRIKKSLKLRGKTREEIYGDKEAERINKQHKRSAIERFGVEKANKISELKRNLLLGKTYEDHFGVEKAQQIKLKQSQHRKGKTYEEIYGVEKAIKLKQNRSITNYKHINKLKRDSA